MNLTRRSALLGTAAAAVAPAIACIPANAAAPAVGKQAPGFYRYKVGDIEVTVVTDGVVRAKLADNFVTNVKVDEVKDALAAAHYDRDIFNNTFTPIVLNTGGKLVLIDTGTGEAASRHEGDRRSVRDQSGGGRIESGRDRYGHHLALPRRSHERPAQGRQLARLPQCRNPRAGERAQVLDGRRRDEPRAEGPHRRAVQEQSPRLFGRGVQAPAHLRVGQGGRAGRDGCRHGGAIRPVTHPSSSLPAQARSSCRAT